MTDSRQTEFVKLLTEHQTALRCFILSMLPGCQDTADVLQDTNVVLWEKMDSYEPGSNFRAWAFAVARNKVMQYRSKEVRAKKVALSGELLEIIEEARRDILPESLEAKLQALAHCLDALNKPERDLIRMRYLEDHREEWESLSRPGASIRVALCRIRGKLRECVERRIRRKEALS